MGWSSCNVFVRTWSHSIKHTQRFKHVQLMIFENIGKCRNLDFFKNIIKNRSYAKKSSVWCFQVGYNTQVNRMSRSRRTLAIGGKQIIFGLDMVCIETILFHLESFWGIRTSYRSIVYRMMITLKTLHVLELNLFEFKLHLNSEMQ